MSEAETWATGNLDAFKHRMRISTTDANELTNLTDMLTASFVAICRLVGVDNASDPEVKELIFERTRYTYNDALDEFLDNYGKSIRNAFLANQPVEAEEGKTV